MKIAVRGGHNFQARGAAGIIDETTEDRKVKDATIKYLQKLGHSVLDVTPGNMDSNSDLAYGVNKANSWGAELFISIHFNKAYNSYDGGIGTEGWIYSKGDLAEKVSNRICAKLASTGLKNRGTKTNGFYELRNTNMPAVIVEVCFVEATEDVSIYKTNGSDKIGSLIAEGILDQKISNDNLQPSKKTSYRCVTGSFSGRKNAEDRIRDLKVSGFDSFLESYKENNKDLYRCITGSFTDKVNAEKRVVELKSKGFDSFLTVI
ncbi:MAG: N-acetylmuramoyl-L-alanine amidase [Sarcina sp.]